MPIYEFYCPENHRIYSFLVRSASLASRVPRCPDSPDFTMQKKVSRFAITTAREGAEGGEEDSFADIDETRLAGLLEEMEQGLARLDEANPNPRALGDLVRRFGGILGDSAPPELDELARRLEAGEDSEALDDELGEGFDEAEFELGAAFKKLTRGFRPPERDPQLYEMRDYLDSED